MNQRHRLLPGVPLVESPLFATELAESDFSPEERELALALHRRGYAVVDFPDPDLAERIVRIREHLESHFVDKKDAQTKGVSYSNGRIQNAWLIDPDVKAIAANATILAWLSRLYGRRAFPFQTLNFKIGTQQPVHTDAVHFSSIPPRFMCGVWVALEDIPADAGPLNYVPGSHRWPIIDNAMLGRKGFGQSGSAQAPYQDVWDAMIAAEGAPVETFVARKGQALIWCANLLHGGSPQTDMSKSRWSQVTHYFFEDCVYYTPAFSDEYLGRLQLRNLVSADDGLPRPNLYLGEEILPAPPSSRPSLKKRIRSLFS